MVFSKLFGKKCVRCDATRTKSAFEGVPTCDACELMIHAERERAIACPACSTTMVKELVLNIIVDNCPSCHGAWLDGGELGVLRQALESSGDDSLATGLMLGVVIG
ncbi:MAG: hypothetical protein GY711_28115 [bacterium]|nr:hypothetical protein [bacterium]